MTAEPRTGYILVRDGMAAGINAGWTGPWPPPEELVVVGFALLGPQIIEIEPARQNMAEFESKGFPVEIIKRNRASDLTDEQAASMSRVERGAEYFRDREWP